MERYNIEKMRLEIEQRVLVNATKNYLEEDFDFFKNTPMPKYVSVATDASGAIYELLDSFSYIIGEIVSVITSAGILFKMNKAVFFICLCSGFVNLLISLKHTLKMKDIKHKVRSEKVEVGLKIKDIADNSAVLKRSVVEDVYKDKIDNLAKKFSASFNNMTSSDLKGKSLLSLINVLTNILSLVAFGLSSDKQLSTELVGDFTKFFNIAPVLSNKLIYLSRAFSGMVENLNKYKECMEVLNHKPSVVDKSDAIDINPESVSVEFKNVTFAYPNDLRKKNVFDDFSLKINAGENVVLMGDSGSGKTTFLSLLLREYDIDSGAILVNGMKNDDIKLKSLRKSISYIPQANTFLNDSVKENVSIVKPDATEEEVVNALKLADIFDEVSRKGGIDCSVGQNGLKFSGGQRHRIGLARAFLTQAPMVIFDEPTSDLDVKTSNRVIDNIKTFSAGKTSIIVSHNTDVAMKFGRVIVLKDGKIVCDGRPSDLLQDSNSEFYNMFHSGKKNFSDEDLNRCNGKNR